VIARLSEPFIAIATQVEHGAEGTYPLTDVQADRFMFNAESHYPTHEAEKKIIEMIDFLEKPPVARVADPETVLAIREEVRNIHVSAEIEDYIVDLVNEVRYSSDVIGGVGPRSTISMYKGVRAIAFIDKREYVLPDDVKKLAVPTLRHRVRLRPEAEMDGVTPEDVINKAVLKVAVPK